MPRKKVETAPAIDVKTESNIEPIKENVAEAPVEKKPVAKKTSAKKPAAAAKAKSPAKATSEKKKTSKAKAVSKTTKTTKPATTPKETVKVQFGADEYDFANIKKAVEADYKGKFNGKVKTIDIYIKPEDKAAYYVINSDFSDKVDL